LNDSIASVLISHSTIPVAHEADLRLMPLLSHNQETVASTMEIEEVSAAMESIKKNSAPNSVPNGIAWNANGRLINSSPGPSPGSMPLAKITGKIASPAISATTVSATATLSVVRPMEASLGR